jgi:hypothetical protein
VTAALLVAETPGALLITLVPKLLLGENLAGASVTPVVVDGRRHTQT